MDASIHALVHVIKRRKASGQQQNTTLARAKDALDDLQAKVLAQDNGEVAPAVMSTLLACMRTTDAGAMQAVLRAVAILAKGWARMLGLCFAWHAPTA